MKFKVLYILTIIGLMSFSSHGQRGVRIGYIDTEFILQNVPEYQEATTQLETKLTKWKSEIEKRLAEVETKKKALENEKVLLTKELYEERLEDISFEEAEVLDYQQKRFGPGGDMVIQRTQLIQPVQDQIFVAVKEIAENKKYDFVFDKNADFLMLYSAERYDISDQVLRIINRTSKREQVKNKKERKALEKEEVIPQSNNSKDERAKALEERKQKRLKELEDKRIQREKALEERRQKQKEDKDVKKKAAEDRRAKVANAKKTTEEKMTTTDSTSTKKSDVKDGATTKKTPKQIQEERRAKSLKLREDRKKALEERKKKILEDRKKAREERLKQLKKNDSIRKAKKNKEN